MASLAKQRDSQKRGAESGGFQKTAKYKFEGALKPNQDHAKVHQIPVNVVLDIARISLIHYRHRRRYYEDERIIKPCWRHADTILVNISAKCYFFGYSPACHSGNSHGLFVLGLYLWPLPYPPFSACPPSRPAGRFVAPSTRRYRVRDPMFMTKTSAMNWLRWLRLAWQQGGGYRKHAGAPPWFWETSPKALEGSRFKPNL